MNSFYIAVDAVKNGTTDTESAKRAAKRCQQVDALVSALERLLHPMADDSDIENAAKVLRQAKGE